MIKIENKTLTCSLCNITEQDAMILAQLSAALADQPKRRWVVNIFFGFIIRPDMLSLPVLTMSDAGLSDNCIRLFTKVREKFGADSVCVDRDAPALPHLPVYQW